VWGRSEGIIGRTVLLEQPPIIALGLCGHGVASIRRGVAYVYVPDRKADRPIAHLAGFKGILQVDGYAGYGQLASVAPSSLRMQRNFCELAASDPAPIA
jgi:hypothetical protein